MKDIKNWTKKDFEKRKAVIKEYNDKTLKRGDYVKDFRYRTRSSKWGGYNPITSYYHVKICPVLNKLSVEYGSPALTVYKERFDLFRELDDNVDFKFEGYEIRHGFLDWRVGYVSSKISLGQYHYHYDASELTTKQAIKKLQLKRSSMLKFLREQRKQKKQTLEAELKMLQQCDQILSFELLRDKLGFCDWGISRAEDITHNKLFEIPLKDFDQKIVKELKKEFPLEFATILDYHIRINNDIRLLR